MLQVYLAGLISTDFPDSLLWRDEVIGRWIVRKQIHAITPMDSKRNLWQNTKDGGVTDHRLAPGDILLRDFHDVLRADVILVNLNNFGSPRPMVGTWPELGWAWEYKKPIIGVATEGDPNYYLAVNHPFVKAFVTHYFNTLDEACGHIENYYVRG